jgi:hypothetical protein
MPANVVGAVPASASLAAFEDLGQAHRFFFALLLREIVVALAPHYKGGIGPAICFDRGEDRITLSGGELSDGRDGDCGQGSGTGHERAAVQCRHGFS